MIHELQSGFVNTPLKLLGKNRKYWPLMAQNKLLDERPDAESVSDYEFRSEILSNDNSFHK